MNSSRLLDKAVDQFASLPGVGRKTALKFVLHLLKKDVQEVDDFLKSIGDLKKNIKECRRCHNISDGEICEICSDPKRDNTTLCVVENIKDILSIEATSQYNGLYHVLGGIIMSVPQQQTVLRRDTVASLRLDSVLAVGFSLSRSRAAELVRAGRAEVNWQPCDKPDRVVQQVDVLTVRGIGKCTVDEVGGLSKKGRTGVTVKRYI